MYPRISIITTSYNQGQYLREAIDSVLDQRYPNLQYIIIDGGSSDDSVNIIKSYEHKLDFWVSEKDEGQADALNKGLALADGEIVSWLNSDDLYVPGSFFRISEHFTSSGFDFIAGASNMIDERGNYIRTLFTRTINFRSLMQYWRPHFCPPQPSIFFRRACLIDLGYLDTSFNYAMDFDFWMKAVRKYSFKVIPDLLSYYRVHAASKTGSGSGFEKFIPEWKTVIRRQLSSQSIALRSEYYLKAGVNLLKKQIAALRMVQFFTRKFTDGGIIQ